MWDPQLGSKADWAKHLVALGLFEAVQIVEGEIGPVGLLGAGGTHVVVGFGPVGLGSKWTQVWIERPCWGWSDPTKFFVSRRKAIDYALSLAEMIRNAALKEQARRERILAAQIQGRPQ